MSDRDPHVLTVTSTGISGSEWYAKLESRIERSNTPGPGDAPGERPRRIRQALEGPHFVPGRPGQIYKVVVLPFLDIFYPDGSVRFADDAGLTWYQKVEAAARRRGLTTPPMEVACLLRLAMSDVMIEALGLHRIVVMHQQFELAAGGKTYEWRLEIHRYHGGFYGPRGSMPSDGFHAECVGPGNMPCGSTGQGYAYLAP